MTFSAVALIAFAAPVMTASASDQQLAYVKDNDIYIAYFNGSDPLRLTREPNRPKHSLVWSHDGQRLAYVQERADPNAPADLCMISVSVRTPRVVVDGSRLPVPSDPDAVKPVASPAFDPNGQYLYFLAGGNAEGGHLWRVDLSAKSFPATPQPVETNLALRSITIASNGRGAGTRRLGYPGGGWREEICVSPPRKWTSFFDITERGGSLANPGDGYMRPRWSPDGQVLLAIHTERDDLCLFRATSRLWEVLIDGDARDPLEISEAEWRPDGMGVFFTVFDRKARRPHTTWYAPLKDPYDRQLVAVGVRDIAAGGSVKLRLPTG